MFAKGTGKKVDSMRTKIVFLFSLLAMIVAVAIPVLAQTEDEGWFANMGRSIDRAVDATGEAAGTAYTATREAAGDVYSAGKDALTGALDTTQGRSPTTLPAGAQRASEVIGRKVRMPGVDGWLNIRDVIIDTDGRATHVLVAVSGIPIVNETGVLVPADALFRLPDGNYAIEMTSDEAAALPYLSS